MAGRFVPETDHRHQEAVMQVQFVASSPGAYGFARQVSLDDSAMVLKSERERPEAADWERVPGRGSKIDSRASGAGCCSWFTGWVGGSF